jgi:hypothetical protein
MLLFCEGQRVIVTIFWLLDGWEYEVDSDWLDCTLERNIEEPLTQFDLETL